MHLRRYEILLPLQYNDGSAVEAEKFKQSRDELIGRFGAVSSEPDHIQGQWKHGEVVYSDNLVRLFVDVDDSPEVRSFFVEWKDVLKHRFDQLEIWITHHEIGRI